MNYELAKAELTLRYLGSVLERLQLSGPAVAPGELDKAVYDVELQRLTVEQIRAGTAAQRRHLTMRGDPTPDPAQMGLGDEVIDILKRAGVKAEEMAAAVLKTGREAAAALNGIVTKLRDLFFNSTAP